jgi:quercetin dioxygenase-like cupin family protein
VSARRFAAVGLVFVAGSFAGAAAVTWAQSAPRMSAQVVLNIVTEELRWARTNVRVNVDTWQPGSEVGQHKHPGPTIIYVLEGQLEETSAEGTRTLSPGQVVWNRGQRPHNVRNTTDRIARALAVHLDPGR